MRSILKKSNVSFLESSGNPRAVQLSTDSGQFSPDVRNGRGHPTLPYIQNPPNYEQSNYEMHSTHPVRTLVDQNFSSPHQFQSVEKDAIEQGSIVPTIQNSELSMPVYNAKWKDGLLDAYKQQMSQLSQAMVQIQQQNEYSSKMEAEKSSSNTSAINDLMNGQKRMFDMYWELSKRCKHVEEVSKKQAELITSLNEMMERREAQHRREIDRLREEIYRTRLRKKPSEKEDSYRRYESNYHPSSAPVERPFVESIDFSLKPPRLTSKKPPPHPQRQPRYDSRYGDQYFQARQPSPSRNRAPRPPVADYEAEYQNYISQDEVEAEREYSERNNDFERDRMRTKNKLKGIESKLMELKIMTQDM